MRQRGVGIPACRAGNRGDTRARVSPRGGTRQARVLTPLLILLAACGHSDRKKTIDIAVVVKALDSEFWQRLKNGAEQAARAQPDVKLAVLAPEREINIDQQVSILEDQILKRISALAVAPAGVAEILPVLDKAKGAGIPVIVLDTDIDWPSKLCYIGTDNRLGGRMAGEYIANRLGGRGKVAVIRGVLGVRTHEERLAGFQQALAAAPAIRCVAVQPANSERAQGMSVMENLLTTHPDLRAVFATNDQMALGAMEAVAAHKLEAQISIVGFDATREAVRAVETGRLAAVVAQNPERMGRAAVDEAVRAAKHEPVDKRVDTGTALVTQENAARFLK
ncbi:MAG: sugar ABC transporter substrate-binding protein [Acidobacteriia bacterium]|nr:sugar ABC transporter substrate-binding protein [Terriglobia bacterium]